jgi:adenylate kinase
MYIIMGLPGAGKSTVIASLMKLMPDLKVINFGDVALEAGKRMYKIESRDDMRKKLSVEQQQKLQEETVSVLSKMAGRNVLLDTHCAVKTKTGYLPGLPFWMLQKLKVDGLMLVSAKPEEIFNRRKNDPLRPGRDAETLDEMKLHDAISRYMLAAYAVLSGAPAMIITNEQGKVEEAAKKAETMMRGK